MKPIAYLSALLPLFGGAALAADVSADVEPIITYEQQVRPIFKAHCFQCHGEAGNREGGLDLRLARLTVKGGDSGAAVVPGMPDQSLLIERVRAGEMPPKDKKLSTGDIEIIARWIAGGARTAELEPATVGDDPLFTEAERRHWAFQPIRGPTPPTVAAHDQVRTSIDAFLLARLEAAGQTFSPDADRPTLLRRAWFDLVGLPPPPGEIKTFIADASPDAWARAIDRLLASPRYGERWGRHWLDVAGYADSEGYSDDDAVREWAFRYRDYVIRSFNADKPFDQFIQEQLAGDEMIAPPYANLSPEAIEKLTATGFLRMAPDGTGSPGVDANVARNQVVADTLQIVCTSLLGLTVHCAQCHDHRYDPIPQADYYRLRAVFEPALDWKNWRPPAGRRVSLRTDAERQVAAGIEAEAAAIDGQRQVKAQEYIDRTLEEELLLTPAEKREALRTAYKTPDKDRTAEHRALLNEYPSVANISVGSLYLYDGRRDEKARRLDAERRQKEQQYVAAAQAREVEKLPEAERPAVQAALIAKVETRTAEQTALLAKYSSVVVNAGNIKQFDAAADAELAALAKSAAELRATKAAEDLKRYSDRAAEVRARIAKEQFVRALTEPAPPPPATFVFYRGDIQQPKQQVLPGDLVILAGVTSTDLPEKDPALATSGRRLAFARHLTDGRHPLVARVLVNRVWLGHFGRGLVATPADFGALGERPTHPELLDWLASEFMDRGWSLKALHRLIMTSAVYRQASQPASADPDNKLYARMSVRRMEAEVVRDAVLAISGELSDTMFGPPVSVMEDDVGQIVIGRENLDGERKPGQAVSLGGEEYRRGLYVQVRRSRPLGLLETFDAPVMSPNCESRNFSTVASQSLVFMNSAFIIDAADHFARRLEREAGSGARDRIARGWLLAFGRTPTESETAEAEAFLGRQTAALRAGSPAVEAASLDHQALASFCQALFSANGFLYID
jgi:mono/diheme cytochrome c family protein